MKHSQMPALFVGHGSPMNALENNDFTRALRKLGRELARPEAILAVSAHWETAGIKVLGQSYPGTIHDFYGFPKELYAMSYPASGAPSTARLAVKAMAKMKAEITEDWGLDHGTWSVLHHLYPKADVPVFQVSLDRGLSFREHYETGRMLSALRREGVMILGSGNIVHNLGLYDPSPDAKPFDWAVEFDEKIKKLLLGRDIDGLINVQKFGARLVGQVMPTVEHYVPLLYVLGAGYEEDGLSFPYEGIWNACMSMRAVLYS